jgi:O-antigen ligase
MNREVASEWCERGIAGLVLAMLVFAALATGAVRTLEFLIVQGLAVGVLLLWLVRLWLAGRPRLFWPPISWAVLGFTVYAVGRYATADIERVARQEFLRVLVYAGVFFAVLNNLQRPETLKRSVRVLVFLAMGISAYAVYQYLTKDNRVWHFINPYESRGSGTFINPNHLAGFLELLIPVGLAHIVMGRNRKPVLTILMGYALLVMGAGLAVSFSRGGWIATALALVVLFGVLVFQRRFRWPAVAALTILLLLGGWFFSQNLMSKYRLARVFSGGELNTESRTELLRPALEMWRENVWFGVGPAHYDYRFRQYRPAVVQGRPDRVHNDYVNTLADWGVVGTVLVLAAWGLAGAGVVRTWRGLAGGDNGSVAGSDRLAFVLGASCALLAILVHSLTDYNMHIPANALLVVVWLAWLSSQLRYTSNRAWITSPFLVRGVTSLTLLAGLGYLLWQGQVGAREYRWLERARGADRNSPEYLEALQEAFRVDPMNFDTAYDLGEAHRLRSWRGEVDYQAEAELALEWFGRSLRLNPHDPYAALRYGMCLDWLGRSGEAEAYYNRADALDPRGAYTAAHLGWHFVHVRNLPAAQAWFERSKRLQWNDNEMSDRYLDLVRGQLLEAATNRLALP